MKLDPKFIKNTSLQNDIQNHPKLAKQLKARYPDRFAQIAGPQYVEIVDPPKPDKGDLK